MVLLLVGLLGACAPTENEDFSRPSGPMGLTDGPSDGVDEGDTGDTGSTD